MKKVTADNLLKTLPYIQFQNDVPCLKPCHQYYGQVQLGMAVLKLEKCHFIIHEADNDTCAIVEVPKDDMFIKDLLQTLSDCYFIHILPWLMENVRNKENK